MQARLAPLSVHGKARLRRRILVVLCAAAILCAPLLPRAMAAADADAASPTSSRVAAVPAPALLDPQGLRIAGPARLDGASVSVGRASVELDRLIAVDYPGSVPCWLDQGVVLADGDIIRGVVSGLGADGLAFASDMGGAMVIPLADLAAVVLAPVRLATAAPDGSAVPGALLSNGDRLSGSPQSIADGRLGLDTGRRIVQLPLDRVRMVILRAPTPPTGAYQAVRLANGDRRSGTLTALSDASFSLRMASGTLTLPTRMLRSLWSEGGALTPLESLPIARLAVVPQFDEQPSASMDRLRDGWIMAGGRRIEHGLVLDAGCIASVALDGRCSRFIAELALASSEGTAEAKVLVDGKVAFESGPMGAADGPRPVCVSLAGAHTLDLAVTPSLACDSAHAPVSWAWPTVVR